RRVYGGASSVDPRTNAAVKGELTCASRTAKAGRTTKARETPMAPAATPSAGRHVARAPARHRTPATAKRPTAAAGARTTRTAPATGSKGEATATAIPRALDPEPTPRPPAVASPPAAPG